MIRHLPNCLYRVCMMFNLVLDQRLVLYIYLLFFSFLFFGFFLFFWRMVLTTKSSLNFHETSMHTVFFFLRKKIRRWNNFVFSPGGICRAIQSCFGEFYLFIYSKRRKFSFSHGHISWYMNNLYRHPPVHGSLPNFLLSELFDLIIR